MEAFISATPLHTRRRPSARISPRRAPSAKAAKDDGSFAGMAAGPGKPSQQAKKSLSRPDAKATRALGKKRANKPQPIQKKTAADFVAEGVVDDVATPDFAEADIRFAVDDVRDPFLQEETAIEEQRRDRDKQDEDERIGNAADVTGDGGVLKTILQLGDGELVPAGAEVQVEYKGQLDGTVFDESAGRGPFAFSLGSGEVIKGWEAAVGTMKVGERALLRIAPSYAYGRRGMPPVIPGNATLDFEVSIVSFSGGADEEIQRVQDFNPTVARTPDEIDSEYRGRLKTQEERRKNMSLLDRFYFISPFASQSGERPPWWLNPNITFTAIVIGVAVGFYVVYISGAIHVGYVDQPVDVNIFK